MTKPISAMELTTLLNKTKFLVSDLTVYEHRFLSFLLARVNRLKMSTHGYLAWPGTDEIIEYTGISRPTIERVRKTLVQKNWMQYIPGKGPGSSNHYYVNAQKIVDAYVQSGFDRPESIVLPTILEDKEAAKKQHKRNTEGLMKGKEKPIVQKIQDKPVFDKMYYGVRCLSQQEYDEAVRKRQVEIDTANESEDCPF